VSDQDATPTATPSPAPSPAARHRPSGAVNPGPVLYKGEPLEPARGPGLGCFRFQMIVLVVLILATPLSVGRVPDAVTAILLFATLGVLLVSGQTMIFLLRLVAAERRDRREPLAARTPTVGQLEDAAAPEPTLAPGPTPAPKTPEPAPAPAPAPTPAADPATPDPTLAPDPTLELSAPLDGAPGAHDVTGDAGDPRGPVPD
jgi:hypothetical protein